MLIADWCFACGKHLYMWKCSVLMQSQACVLHVRFLWLCKTKTVDHAPARRWVRVNPDDVAGVCVATVWASAAICVSGMHGNGTLRMCWCQRVLRSCLDGAFALKKSLQGSGLLWLQHCGGRLQFCVVSKESVRRNGREQRKHLASVFVSKSAPPFMVSEVFAEVESGPTWVCNLLFVLDTWKNSEKSVGSCSCPTFTVCSAFILDLHYSSLPLSLEKPDPAAAYLLWLLSKLTSLPQRE